MSAPVLIGACVTLLAVCGGCRCGDRDAVSRETSGPAVVLVDPEEDDGLPVIAEREPNDGRSRAQPLSEGTLVKGLLSAADRDWYRVDIKRPQLALRAQLSGVSGQDVVLEAFAASGARLVKVDSSGAGGGEVLPNLGVEPGAYFLRVSLRPASTRSAARDASAARSPAKQAAVYRLKLSLTPRQQGEEIEPNWRRAQASPLSIGAIVSGYVGWRDDTDWYALDTTGLSAASLLMVEFDGVDSVRPTLWIRTDRGRVIQRRRGSVGEAVTASHLLVPAGAKQLFIVVSGGRSFNVESRYGIRVSTTPAQGLELEPNDTPELATAIADGTQREGTLDGTRDRDLFSVPIARVSRVTAVVSPPLGLDVALGLVGDRGQLISEVDEARTGKPEQLLAVVARPPRALLRIRAARGSSDAGRYRLSVKLMPMDGGEIEPNDTRPSATNWTDQQRPMDASIGRGGDVDYFTITGAGKSLQLAMHAKASKTNPADVPPMGAGSLDLAVVDGSQHVVANARVAGADGVLRVTFVGAAGQRYWIRVRTRSTDVAVQLPYRLVLSPGVEPVGAGTTKAPAGKAPHTGSDGTNR